MIYLFGCLPVLLILLVMMVFAVFGRTIEMLGATAVWLWDSFTNLFRSADRQKRTVNPWTGVSNFDPLRNHTAASSASASSASSRGTKIYAPGDGEYIDYEEL